jgi:hypothetical protein
MATNMYICEVCNKGFQREQNLQLHIRGHNLPWKPKQKTTKEPKRKGYLCLEHSIDVMLPFIFQSIIFYNIMQIWLGLNLGHSKFGLNSWYQIDFDKC